MSSQHPYILVTGATGFIGAHVVDSLLNRGIKVRAATRSNQKGESLKAARPEHSSLLDTVQIKDFSESASFAEAIQGVTGVIHVASPFTYDVKDLEKELVRPAIAGVKAILAAAAASPDVKRVVITSSFAAVMDANAPEGPQYTAESWNPLSYEEAVNTNPIVAYRGSKKFAELEAWKFAEERKPSFDIVTLCPPMTFGPVCHPVEKVSELNESNAMLWNVASGKDLPVARIPYWIDVRDLAQAHVEALLRPEVGGRRFTVSSPELFSYELAGQIIEQGFDWGKDRVARGEKQHIDGRRTLNGETAAKDLGLVYTKFEECVKDFVKQAVEIERGESGS